jgi:hypothetical protein
MWTVSIIRAMAAFARTIPLAGFAFVSHASDLIRQFSRGTPKTNRKDDYLHRTQAEEYDEGESTSLKDLFVHASDLASGVGSHRCENDVLTLLGKQPHLRELAKNYTSDEAWPIVSQ